MKDLQLAISAGGIAAGEAYLADTPVLRPHVGTQPDLFLRWNAIPPAAPLLDVVVHLHGFSEEGRAMPLAEKVGRSGLDLSGRERPTLALLPRGNWIRYRQYDFPALLSGGIDVLVEYALQHFSRAAGVSPPFAAGRLILTAHSGGGMPAVDAIAAARRAPDELHVFDGLYGRDPRTGDPFGGIETVEKWLIERLAGEPRRPGALRIVYIENQTGPFSRKVGQLIERHLAAADPGLQKILARRYRAEPAGVPHPRIASRCGPELLRAADAVFDWSR